MSTPAVEATPPVEPATEAPPAEQTAPEGTEQEQVPEGEKPAEEPAADESKDGELPEWARNELSRVRGEAASYRTKLRDAESKLENAKTPEEFEAAVTELKNTNADLERSLTVTKVAAEHKLPPELAELLKGNTPEELAAHAKALAKFAPAEEVPEHLSGGLDPSDSDQSFDPVAAAKKARTQRRY